MNKLSCNIQIIRHLRKNFIYNNSFIFLQNVSYGFLAFNNNLTTKELLSLSNYLSLFGFFIKKVPSSFIDKLTTLKKGNKQLKGNILILYTDTQKNLKKFPIVSFYSLNKNKLPIFSVLFNKSLFSLNFFYKNILGKLIATKKESFSFFLLNKINLSVKFFRFLQILFFKALYK